jgi:hypothetical protein
MNNPSIRKKTFDSINKIMRKDTTNDVLRYVDNFIREDSVWCTCTDLTECAVNDCLTATVRRSVITTCIKELLNQNE